MSVLSVVAKKLADGKEVREKIKAYHGSPHDFDKFSSDNIGSGEGAQAYGRGLYFAERKGTAESYRDSLTSRDAEYEDWLMRQYKDAESGQDYARMEMYERAMMHDKPNDLRDLAKDTDYDEDYRELANQVADEIESFTKVDGTKPNFGKMYEVDIDATDDELLNYDLPINEQSEKVQKAIQNYFENKGHETYMVDGASNIDKVENATRVYIGTGRDSSNRGSEIYASMQGLEGNIGVADALRQYGVKGIKYADAQTRFSPKGKTHNYVIFDDNLIEISRKYGIPPAIATAVLAGSLTPEQAQAQAENEARRGMSLQERRHNPPSAATIKYNKRQALKAPLAFGLGALRETANTLDFIRPENLIMHFNNLPQLTNKYAQLVSPVTDTQILDDQEADENAKFIGGFLGL